MRGRGIVAGLLAALVLTAAVAPGLPVRAAPGDELLIVDCLLPGKVRKLGKRVTFMTARKAVRTTAADCEIRGGEYTAYDRANYATALKIWLPLAKDGDPAAQTHVGEIYEKGLGVDPQYELAAAWYLKAAKSGYARAQMNLGALYERGLGVQKDMVKAVEWYRRASGLSDANIAYVPSDVRAEIEQLRSERDTLARERDALRGQLDAVQAELKKAREELLRQHRQTSRALTDLETARVALERQRNAARKAGDDAKVKQLEAALEGKSAEAERRKQELGRMRERVAALNGQATQLQSALERARSERDQASAGQAQLADVAARLRAAEAELARTRRSEAESSAAADKIRAALATEQSAGQRDAAKIKRLEAELAAKESALATRDQRLAELSGEVSSLRRETETLKKREAPTREVAVADTGPVIEMIEPPVAATRSTTPASVAVKATEERLIVGRVRAAKGLIALMVNDVEQEAGGDGVFKAKLAVQYPETPVRIVAIDGGGQRTALNFVLKPEAAPKTKATPAPSKPPLKEFAFGKFHALVIGNNAYRRLPPLRTAVADAEAVDELLRKRYGFETTLLLNADRYSILATLNKLRADLTEDDNLLIYYAGHGELDRVNDRGHWLPIDAEPDSTANWISNIQITDILNAMLVRQIMIVADSCYSGTLTRAALAELEPGMSDEARYKWIKVMASKRARVVLSSGGVQPVLDNGGGGHSIFAKAFLAVLRDSGGIVEGQRVYREVAQILADSAAARIEQVPSYAPIKYAGHEAGDFFFVPVAN